MTDGGLPSPRSIQSDLRARRPTRRHGRISWAPAPPVSPASAAAGSPSPPPPPVPRALLPLQPPPRRSLPSLPRNGHGDWAGDGDDGGPPPVAAADAYADADRTLRALAAAAEGFGRRAIGGLHGALYHVTSLQDDGHGTLRESCRAKEPLWIVFEVSGDIHLHTYLRVSSHKTIDGRGQRVRLTGKGLQLKDCHHVIVCNLRFEAGRGHDVDGIQIKPGSTNIWIDRCSLADYDDGLIDITRQSTDITVSRCHFARHDKTMLIGADPTHVDDRCIRVTIHHCFFDGTRQRHPRLRFGKVHLYNNYTRDWGIYAVCASVEAQIVSQCNIYEGGHKKTVFKYMPEKAADREETVAGWIRSEGDAFLHGALPCLVDGPGAERVFRPEEYYDKWTMEAASPALKEVIQLCAGWQPVPRPPDC